MKAERTIEGGWCAWSTRERSRGEGEEAGEDDVITLECRWSPSALQVDVEDPSTDHLNAPWAF